MKKIILLLSFSSLILLSCKSSSTEDEVTPEIDITTQNSYDDQAAQKFLNDNYLDSRGNIKAFSDTDTSDDNYPKLSSLNPVTLPSGVIYIVRNGAQPTTGTTIGSSDIIRMMASVNTYVAQSSNNVVSFSSAIMFSNSILGTGNLIVDPSYYYVKQSVLDANTAYTRSYYEIEGFREALQKFKAFDISDSENYNLQGVIIVPSRAAFARDDHYPYGGISWRNRSFIFNFQIYKTTPRS